MVLEYPFYEDGKQLCPFKTLSMLISLASHVLVSLLTRHLFQKGYLSREADVFGCYVPGSSMDQFTFNVSQENPQSCKDLQLFSIPRPSLQLPESSLNDGTRSGVNNQAFVS